MHYTTQLYKRLWKKLDDVDPSKGLDSISDVFLPFIVEDPDIKINGARYWVLEDSSYKIKKQHGNSNVEDGYSIKASDYDALFKKLGDEGMVILDRNSRLFNREIEGKLGIDAFVSIGLGEKMGNYYSDLWSFTLEPDIIKKKDYIDELSSLLKLVRSVVNEKVNYQKIEQRLIEARELQLSILPKSNPDFFDYDIFGISKPAETEQVGGDFYDFIKVNEDTLGLLIGDATSKGFGAAMLAVYVHGALKLKLMGRPKIIDALSDLNRLVNESPFEKKAITLFYGEVERNGLFLYANAGHPYPLLLHEGVFTELDVGGPLIGPIQDAKYNRDCIKIQKNDILLLYTDGIIDPSDKEGMNWLKSVVADNQRKTSKELVELIFEELDKTSNPEKNDDKTLVVVKR